MTKITRNRGTESVDTDNTESNWAGKKFKKYQQEKTQKGTITSGRGTSSKQLEDIPKTDLSDDEEVQSKVKNRGTSR
jgi:hypothetical protein